MKIIRCTTCGDIAGVYSTPFIKRRFYGPCPGKGNHKHRVVKKKRLFWRNEVWHFYDETHTHSHYFEYTGIVHKWRLAIALLVTPGHSLWDMFNERWI